MTAEQAAMAEIKTLDTLIVKAQKTGAPEDWEAYHNAFSRTRGQLLRGFWTRPAQASKPDSDFRSE